MFSRILKLLGEFEDAANDRLTEAVDRQDLESVEHWRSKIIRIGAAIQDLYGFSETVSIEIKSGTATVATGPDWLEIDIVNIDNGESENISFSSVGG